MIKKYSLDKNTTKNRTKTVNVGKGNTITKVRVKDIKGNSVTPKLTYNSDKTEVKIEITSGDYKRELVSGSYTPSRSKEVTATRNLTATSSRLTYFKNLLNDFVNDPELKNHSSSDPLVSELRQYDSIDDLNKSKTVLKKVYDYLYAVPDTNVFYYSSGGYRGNLNLIGDIVDLTLQQTEIGNNIVSGIPFTITAEYKGTVTKPSSDTRVYKNYYQYDIEVEYDSDISLTFLEGKTRTNDVELKVKASETTKDTLLVNYNGKMQTISGVNGVYTFTIKKEDLKTSDNIVEATLRYRGRSVSIKIKVNKKITKTTYKNKFAASTMKLKNNVKQAVFWIERDKNAKYKVLAKRNNSIIGLKPLNTFSRDRSTSEDEYGVTNISEIILISYDSKNTVKCLTGAYKI